MAKLKVITQQDNPPPIDPVLAVLAHCEPHIQAGRRPPSQGGADENEKAADRAHAAALALAVAIPATTLRGLAGQIAALAAVIDWRDAGEDSSSYTKAHVELSARHVADFLVSASTTLARMGAAPPSLLAEYGMGHAEFQRLEKIGGMGNGAHCVDKSTADQALKAGFHA